MTFFLKQRVELNCINGLFPSFPNGTGILAGLHANSGNLSYRIDNVHRLKRLNLDIFLIIVAMEEAKARLMKRLLIKTPGLLAKRFFKDGVSLFTRYFFSVL